ncbi:carbohydrate kinase [Hyphomonas hirschiana VP5]|uniref:Carbohydrate kinase n=1 Tax=Hyphomonas hirschiana VP5 TaxID=1280951 RepID=A0A059F7P1_9PROT|nr:carbohydrate kinase [Hyphomonas hirschiana VP5]
MADGVSSSRFGGEAAEIAVKSFLTDYYCTSDAWSVKTSARRVLEATNSWLFGQTRARTRGEGADGGYVTTFSALVIKGRVAHLLHVGDGVIGRLRQGAFEPLTEPHRVVLSPAETYLGRALGAGADVEIDYRSVALSEGDLFVLATDGAADHIPWRELSAHLNAQAGDLDLAAARLVAAAKANGSDDNLTVQIIRIDALPESDASDMIRAAQDFPPPPPLDALSEIDGLRILRKLHANARSHVYLVLDPATHRRLVLKAPAAELCADPVLLRRFMMEEWVARRVSSPHIVPAADLGRARSYLYVLLEFVDGQSLRQLMNDQPELPLETVRTLLEQIVAGVRALHRKEIAHGDLRPENILIDGTGGVQLIDFGSAHVAGIADSAIALPPAALGALQYAAPELLLGEPPGRASDQFAIGVIAYELLTGRLPYGAAGGKVRSDKNRRALTYQPATRAGQPLPAWINGALRTATDPLARRRYEALSEFLADLRAPNPRFLRERHAPLIERNPLRFWQGLCALLAALSLFLAIRG